MYKGHRIGVVVPVYNEAAFVGDVLDGLPAFVDRAYPVDDCSTDASWAVIKQRAVAADEARVREAPAGSSNAPADHPDSVVPQVEVAPDEEGNSRTDGGQSTGTQIVPLRHETNRGRGAAVKTGYKAALDDEIDIVAVLDGDGQMDPDMLDRLIAPIVDGEADYAKGNRLATAELRNQMSRWRLFGNALLTLLTRAASGYWRTTDAQNGYTAVSSEALGWLDIDMLYDDYGFLNDVLVHLNVHDARVVDVPMPAVYGDEESGITYRTFVPRLSALLVGRFLWRLRSTDAHLGVRPVAALYVLAGLVGLGGVGYSLLTFVTGRSGIEPIGLIAVIGLCPLLVVAAILVERRATRDRDFDAERPIDDRV